jgi:hypothetical protein
MCIKIILINFKKISYPRLISQKVYKNTSRSSSTRCSGKEETEKAVKKLYPAFHFFNHPFLHSFTQQAVTMYLLRQGRGGQRWRKASSDHSGSSNPGGKVFI